MRTETTAYKAQRAQWVNQPAKFIRAEYVRRAGDLTSYPFTRDFSEYDVVASTITKLKVVKDMRGQTQELNPVAGRSSIGTLEVDLAGSEVLKQIADPAKPLVLAIRGSATVRNASHVRSMPAAKILYASTWTQSGLASFTAAEVNDDDTETTVAFDADAAAAASWLKLDLGASGDRAFISVVVYTGLAGIASGSVSITPGRGALDLTGGKNQTTGYASPPTGALALTGYQPSVVVHNAYWWVQYSDDDTTWTTISKGTSEAGFGTGGHRVDSLNFPYSSVHRYWRLLKQNAAQAGPDYYEVQFSELALGRNTIVQVEDSSGYPSAGHILVDDEDIFYSAKTDALGVFGDTTYYGTTRAARDTVLGDHGDGTLVRNGEQLRRGTRIAPFLGYQPMDEDDYMQYTKLEIQSLVSKDSNLTWVLRCADIQRFVKRKIFELATETNPVNLTGHPITILLQVWMSTGIGNNGPYDVLSRENGAAVPMALIDVAGWEEMRGFEFISGMTFAFTEIEPQDSKEWGESQIMRPLMILPDVNQSGQLTGRRVATPLFSHGGMVTGKIKAA